MSPCVCPFDLRYGTFYFTCLVTHCFVLVFLCFDCFVGFVFSVLNIFFGLFQAGRFVSCPVNGVGRCRVGVGYVGCFYSLVGFLDGVQGFSGFCGFGGWVVLLLGWFCYSCQPCNGSPHRLSEWL